MGREFEFCAYCNTLTNGRDADGDPACPQGLGCLTPLPVVSKRKGKRRRKRGVTRNKDGRPRKPRVFFTEKEVEVIVQMINQKRPIIEVARHLGRGYGCVLARIKALKQRTPEVFTS